MVFVSVTRLRARSWRYLPAFYLHSLRSVRQAAAADAILSISILRDKGNTFWTRTLWQSEATMRAFMLSGAHAHAMPSLHRWCDEASVAHWFQDEPQEPSWQQAFQRMLKEGRPSKLRYPSEAHRAYEIRLPALGTGRELRYL